MNKVGVSRHLKFIILCASTLAASVSQATSQSAGDPVEKLRGLESPERIEGSYIVALRDEYVAKSMLERHQTDPEYAVRDASQDFTFRYGGRIEFTYGHAIKGFAVSGIDDATAKAISEDPRVAYVETDKVYTVETVQSPATWGLDRIDQRSLPLSNSYSYTSTGYGVRAYVVDSGIKAHNEFGTRLKAGYTAIGDGNGTSDCNGHGTHVAGTLGGTTYGVAKGVDLYPVRVLDCGGSGSSSQIVAGLNWVETNATAPAVVNLSLGGPVDTSIDNAVTALLAKNFTVTVAAGNYFDDACLYSPARLGGTSNVLSVANSTNTDARNELSNWGRCVTLFAPGTNITSAGIASVSATAVMSGTSMSSPHVAGAAALYLQADPTASAATVKTQIVYASTRGAISNTGSSPNRLLYTGFGVSGGSDPAYTPVPPTPTNLRAYCVANGGLWQFRWSSTGDPGMFELYRNSTFALRSAANNVQVGVGTSGSSTWKVRACNGAGCSAFSSSVLVHASQICP